MSKRASRPFSILVGPPHPISNLRPVLYNGIPDQTKTNAYSPNELRPNLSLDPTKFQLDLTLQRLDKFNHDFWLNSNERFHSMKHAFLAARKPRLELARSPEERAQMEDDHLAEFYRLWMETERNNQRQYTSEWLRGQYGALWTALRLKWQTVKAMVTP